MPETPSPAGGAASAEDLPLADRLASAQPGAVQELRRRVAVGAVIVGLRGVAVRVLALAGNVVIARLVTPDQLGLVAFGATVSVFASFWADAGMGGALIRQDREPDRADYAALLFAQLALFVPALVILGIVAWPHGDIWRVTVLMIAGLPISTFRTPASLSFERALRYGALVSIDLSEAVVYYGWSIVTLALGFGVWGLATAALARAVAGCVAAAAIAGGMIVVPRFSATRTRRLLSFGARFQGAGLVGLLRDQAINFGLVALAGTSALGIWSLANRLLQVPFLLFETLWRVSYPAMVRLLRIGEDAAMLLERGMAVTAIGAGLLLVPLVAGGGPLVAAVFGDRWRPVADTLPWASLGLIVSGPVSVATIGYLCAVGDAGAMLRATVANSVLWIATALPLVPRLGATAVGVGFVGAAVAEAVILVAASRRHLGDAGLAYGRALVGPVATAIVAGATGFAVTQHHPGAAVAVAVAVGADVMFLLLGAALFRPALQMTVRSVALVISRRGAG